ERNAHASGDCRVLRPGHDCRVPGHHDAVGVHPVLRGPAVVAPPELPGGAEGRAAHLNREGDQAIVLASTMREILNGGRACPRWGAQQPDSGRGQPGDDRLSDHAPAMLGVRVLSGRAHFPTLLSRILAYALANLAPVGRAATGPRRR